MFDEMIASGTGLYTLGDAARYARINPGTVSRWFKGDASSRSVFPVNEEKIITFLDFVQILAVRNLRSIYGVKLQKIREAVDRASAEFSINHPFARKHTTFLFDGEIWIQPEGKIITQVSGKIHGQTGIIPVIEKFYEDISFDPESGLASLYKAYERGANKIIMNPRVRFGEPILSGCGYTPEALFEAAKTEGSYEAAAKSYGVTVEQVKICVDYFDHLAIAA